MITIAEEDPAAARSATSTNEGLLRTGRSARACRACSPDEDQLISTHATKSRSRANQAVLIGSIALGVGFLLCSLVASWSAPWRDPCASWRAARRGSPPATSRLASERAAAEIRELTTAFNAMAESVEHGRRELEVQNEQLRQSERAKSELITIVSHELRTPLSSILGYTRLLLKRDADAGPQDRAAYVEIIHDQGERLAGLIEGFLAAEDANGGGIELDDEARRPRRARPPRGRPDRRRRARPRAQRRGRRGPLVVLADGERLAQVVINLLDNAVKYSPAGGRSGCAARRQGGSFGRASRTRASGSRPSTSRACSASSSAARRGRAGSRESASGSRCPARSSRRTAAASTSRARRTGLDLLVRVARIGTRAAGRPSKGLTGLTQ